MKILRLLFALLPAAAWASPPDLIARSHQILKPKGWMQIQLNVPYYEWLSNHQIVYWNDDREDSRPHVYDLTTNSSQELTWLTHLASKYRLREFDLSPNGKWLLFGGWVQESPHWFACHLDGTGLISWPRYAAPIFRDRFSDKPLSFAHWSSNGDFITETESGPVPQKATAKVWVRPFPEVTKEIACPPVATHLVWTWIDAYEVGGQRMVSVSQPVDPYVKAVDLLSWVADKPSTLQHFQMKLPEDTIPEYRISPDRKKLLWEFKQGLMTPDDTIPKGPKSLSLWVSDLKGGNLREIGRIEIKDSWKSDEDQDFGGLQWLPDSESTSFIYFGKLYEIAAG
jgi:hypothetical protein